MQRVIKQVTVHEIYELIITHNKNVSPNDLSWELKLAETIHNAIYGEKK